MSGHLRFCATLCGSLLVASLFTGCGSSSAMPAGATVPLVTGNWQLSSNSTSAGKLPSLSGELSGPTNSVTGIFHANSSTACVSSTVPIEVSGSANGDNVLTLVGDLAGGALSISGTLAADGKSLTNASYNVSGGTCAFPSPAPAVGQN